MKDFDSDIARAGGYTLPFMGILPFLMMISITIFWWILVTEKAKAYLVINPDGYVFPMYLLSFLLTIFFWISFYFLMKVITKPVWDIVNEIDRVESNEKKDIKVEVGFNSTVGKTRKRKNN